MQLIDDGMARHGDVIWALHQTNGRGQRGREWKDEAGENIAMSLILMPDLPVSKQFYLSATVACVIAKYLQTIYSDGVVTIKWPNDIYINDKKACGILIENVFRGMDWTHAVVGMGLNVNQVDFPEDMPNATSLGKESGKQYDLQEIVTDIRAGILNSLLRADEKLFDAYNNLLFKRGKQVNFQELENGKKFTAFVQEVTIEGELVLLTNTGIESYRFGSLAWLLQ